MPCPEDANEPQTAETRALWALVPLFSGRWKPGGLGGPAGFDLSECERVAAVHGVEADAVARWLPFIERGALAGMRARRDQES